MTAKKPRLRRACGVIAAMLTITRLTAVTAPAAVLTITRLKKRTRSGAFLLSVAFPAGVLTYTSLTAVTAKKPRLRRACGVPGGSRTHGLSLRRRTLYPTELRKHAFCKSIIYYAVWKIKQFYAAGAIHLR